MHEIDKTKPSDQTKFRLYELKKTENYFINEISDTKSCSKKLNKYVTIFDYINKSLIVLSATTGGVSIISFASAIGAPVGIASACCTLIFYLTTGIIKKLLSTTRKKKKKHDKILMLAKSKFSNIETLVSQALIDMGISHEEFITIIKKKDRYEMLEITRKNCYKCNLETIITNDSQYFWINLKDFEVETERNWQHIFIKHGNSSTIKYRKELTPHIQFQSDKIFTRNDLFERTIKSCKETNAEFLMLKENLDFVFMKLFVMSKGLY